LVSRRGFDRRSERLEAGDDLAAGRRFAGAGQFGGDLCAVRLDQLRYEYAAAGDLVGGHDDQVESQPVARHVLQIADQLDQVGWCLIEDDHGSQPTIVERALEVRGPEGIMVGLAEQLS
jgi:hypothetical protein